MDVCAGVRDENKGAKLGENEKGSKGVREREGKGKNQDYINKLKK